MRSLIREAQDLGWIVASGSKHWKLRHPPTGATAILPHGSRLSSRSERNIRSRLRSVKRLGLP
jgi:hypothetical protein